MQNKNPPHITDSFFVSVIKQEFFSVASPLSDPTNTTTTTTPIEIVRIQLAIRDEFWQQHTSKNQGKLLIIALDKSGSMVGSGISEAKLALETLLSNVEGCNERILFIVFDSNSELIDMTNMELENKLQVVKKVSAGGGTDFSSVFKIIRNYGGSLNGQVAIIFFTDGQDQYSSNSTREGSIKSLQERLNTESESYEFHTIGFTSVHDARLLTDITRLGTAQGTFQYAESVSSIAPCMASLTELVKGSSFTCQLIVKNKEGNEIFRERVKLEQDNDKSEFIIQSLINTDITPDCELYLEFGENELIIPLSYEAFKRPELSSVEKLSYQIMIIEKFLIEAAGLITKNSSSLKEIHIKCKAIEEKLESITTDIRKMRDKSVRRTLYQMIQPIFESLANFNKILAESMVGTLSNEKIANLNTLAYRSITKRSLQKKLDLRAQANVELFEQAENIIQESVDSMNFTEIKEKYSKQAEEIGPCFYTTSNWIDLLQDKDCLCLGLQVNRPQAAIADPSRVQIVSVSNSMMSAESFLDSVTFSLGSAYNVEDSHGGFKDVPVSQGQVSNSQSKIISGASRESINAVLPLYISEEHWRVSRQKMKPILGFIATLDIMGYSFEQFKTIPFLVLYKLLQESSEGQLTEFQALRLKLVMDTCLQIVKECSAEKVEEKLSETLTKLFSQYNMLPESRTLDVIPNNEVFITQLLCSNKIGLIDVSNSQVDTNLFFKNIAEEELRRKGAFVLNIPEVSVDLWFELLNVDTETMINQFVSRKKEKFMELLNNSSDKIYQYGEIMRKLVGVEENTVSDEVSQTETVTSQPLVDENQDLIDYVLELTQLSPKATELFQKLDKFYNKNINKHLTKIKQWMFGSQQSEISLELDNAAKIILLTQTIDHQKNSDRRYAIDKGEYLSPFTTTPEQRTDHLRATITKHIKNRRNGLYTNFVTEMNSSGINQLGPLFASTSDIYEAAGIIYGRKRGHGVHIALFYYLCQTEKVPHLVAKVKMLATGEFKGILLYSDKMADPVWSIYRSYKRSLLRKLWWYHSSELDQQGLF